MIDPKRRNQLPNLLHAFIESRRHAPFKWGENDCCLFAADWVLELTGDDHAKQYRGKYSDEKGAARIIKRRGGMRAFAQDLKERANVRLAQRGDVVLAVIDERETYGVADVGVYFAPGVDRLEARPMSEVIAAFEVI